MACILLWSSAVRVHDSQAHRKMDVTRERISRILEPREILLSFQTGFSLVNAAAVCAILESISASTNLIQVIKNLYNKATSAVLFNSRIGDWFRTTVGVQQGYLLSPNLFNIFLERIMTDAVKDHEDTVSIVGRTITNLLFANDIDGLAGEEEELANLVERLDKASTAYGMEISTEKTELMTNNTMASTQRSK